MIGSQEKQALSDLFTIISTFDLPIVLVGGGARILIFDQKFGEGRGTKDWDVAISVDSWEIYQQLQAALIEGNTPLFQATKTSHKFIHIETQIEIDIVPFGEIAKPEEKITWPDSEKSMNVLGLAEALSSAETINIGNFEIRAINIAAFIVLKLFAWSDRRDKKDLDDIDFILSKYEDYERVFAELSDELAKEDIALTDASIYLLGRDIDKTFQAKTLKQLNVILDELIERLADHSEKLDNKLTILKQGILSSDFV
jgi:predicted nucleotidyltransferase